MVNILHVRVVGVNIHRNTGVVIFATPAMLVVFDRKRRNNSRPRPRRTRRTKKSIHHVQTAGVNTPRNIGVVISVTPVMLVVFGRKRRKSKRKKRSQKRPSPNEAILNHAPREEGFIWMVLFPSLHLGEHARVAKQRPREQYKPQPYIKPPTVLSDPPSQSWL